MADKNSGLTRNRDVTDKPRIAFMATREPSYSRVAIVHEALEQHFCVISFVSASNWYPYRIGVVLLKFAIALLSGRLRGVEMLFVGFFAQPILPIVRLVWRRPIVCDGYFSIFDTLVFDKAKVGPSSAIGRLCYWLDRFMLRNCDLVLTDTMEHVRYMKACFRAPLARVERLWISAQDQLFTLLPALTLRKGETCEVLFWGGFIPLQGVDVIIRAAAHLKGKRVHFTLVGDGQTCQQCRSLAEELAADNVSFVSWQAGERLRDLASKAHLVLGIFGTTDKAARVIPNKAFEAMALAKPLITGDSPAARELLEDGRDALLVPLGDAEALAERIKWSVNNYEAALCIGRCGYDTFVENASPERVRLLLRNYVRSVIAPHWEPLPEPGSTSGVTSSTVPATECKQ